MTTPIRVVKKEIRILGLDFCSPKTVTGAVVRGGDFLDGIVSFPNSMELDDREVALRIIGTRFYPELRAVMIHDPLFRSRPKIVEKVTKLPVMRVSNVRPLHRGFRMVQLARGRLWVQTGLSRETLEKIVSVTWTFGRLPEPARVAHLLSRTRVLPRPSMYDKN